MNSERSTLRTSGIVATLNSAGLLSGLGRDLTLVAFFGVGTETDAYLIATVLPATLAALLTAAVANVVVVPTYGRLLAEGDRDSAYRFASNLLVLAVLGLGAVGVMLVLAAPTIVSLQAPGLSPGGAELTVTLTRIASPITVMAGVAVIMTGLLNTHGTFGLPGAGRLVGNGAAWLAVLLIAPHHDVVVLTAAISATSVLQVLIQVPPLLSHLRFRPGWPLVDRGTLRVAASATPVLGGMLAIGVSDWCVRALASGLGSGAITSLAYAQRIYAVPVTVLCNSIAQTLLPRFTWDVLRLSRERLVETVVGALRSMTVLTGPVSAVLVILSFDITQVLFAVRDSNHSTVEGIAAPLAAFGLALPLAGVNYVLLSLAYALQDTRGVLYSFTAFAVVQVAIGVAVLEHLGTTGLAFATVTATGAQAIVLLYVVRRSLPYLTWPRTAASVLVPLLPGVVVAAVLLMVVMVSGGSSTTKGLSFGRLAAGPVLAAIPYGMMCKQLCPEQYERVMTAARAAATVLRTSWRWSRVTKVSGSK